MYRVNTIHVECTYSIIFYSITFSRQMRWDPASIAITTFFLPGTPRVIVQFFLPGIPRRIVQLFLPGILWRIPVS
jgi:hypothetical protein